MNAHSFATDAFSLAIDAQRSERSLGRFAAEGWSQIEPSKFSPNWHIDAICDHLTAVADRQVKRLLINIPPRHMKLCADDTPIATPSGYRRHGDLRVGDHVFGPDGLPTRIKAISPKGVADIDVVFGNGEAIKVNGDHLWTVYDRWGRVWRTLATSELMAKSLSTMDAGKSRNRFFVPDSSPLCFDEAQPLPLHPYFVGCWLGDGNSGKPCISHDVADREHIDKLTRLGFRVERVHKNTGNGVVSYFSHQGITVLLRQIGVFNNKRIPDAYATSSVEDRLELLAGLVDTDGHVEARTGRVRVSTCDGAFAAQIERLALSLGFKAYTSRARSPGYGEYAAGHEFVYQVGFQPNITLPTALPRKAITRLDFTTRLRAIADIRPSASPEVGHCITVSRDDGLYIVGRTNLVTHNSQAANVYFPAWVWAQDAGVDASGRPLSIRPGVWRGPGVKFMHLSYVADLSTRDSVRCRQLIDSRWYQSRWGDRFQFTADQNQKTAFVNTRGGERLSRAVGGRVTGDGADIIIFDDPHNVKDGESPVEREKVLRFWDESMPTRLNDAENGAFIVIMQRVHEKDLSGHILAKEMQWTHLCLPALYEPDHPTLTRTSVTRSRVSNDGGKVGAVWEDLRAPEQPLFPERFKDETLDTWAKEMGSYAWAGQGQQRPAPREGGIFQKSWFEVVPAVPASAVIKVRAWDLAGTEDAVKKDPDWSVGLKMSRDPSTGILYIEHVERFRKTPAVVKQLMKTLASIDGRSCTIRIPQDPGATGKFTVADLASMLIGYVVRTEREDGTKEQRAEPFASQCEVHNVKLVQGAWNEPFLDELCSFPNAAHDDQVDAVTAAFRCIAGFANPGPLSGTQSHRR